MAFRPVGGEAPTTVNTSVTRRRNYLTGTEVETLMTAARKVSRYGHRDATMILIAYRHGLRASEVCDLQWHQVELPAERRFRNWRGGLAGGHGAGTTLNLVRSTGDQRAEGRL